MKFYADTSFLVSLYILQTNSGKAAVRMKKLKDPLPLTPLHNLELRNAVRLCIFRNEITALQGRSAIRALEDDLGEGVLVPVPMVWSEILEKAEHLGAAFTELLGCRSMDILHVAAAITLGSTRFVTFDKRQNRLAEKAGLKVD